MDLCFEILISCLLMVEAGGVQLVDNIFTPAIGYSKDSFNVPDILKYTIDINRYNLDLSGITSFVFEVKACRDADILLSNSNVKNSSKPLYEIYLGGWSNEGSIIRYRLDDSLDAGSKIHNYVSTPNILNCNEYLPFWISWESGDIQLGTGLVVAENTLSSWTNANHFVVRGIGILTNRNASGIWKIQQKDTFGGYLDSCSMNDNKADMVVVDNTQCTSEIQCALRCGLSKSCMGFNFNSVLTRCELLSFGPGVVTDIPHHIEAGWRFYSKCYNGNTACLGCYF